MCNHYMTCLYLPHCWLYDKSIVYIRCNKIAEAEAAVSVIQFVVIQFCLAGMQFLRSVLRKAVL
jgi:hypothetical protein